MDTMSMRYEKNALMIRIAAIWMGDERGLAGAQAGLFSSMHVPCIEGLQPLVTRSSLEGLVSEAVQPEQTFQYAIQSEFVCAVSYFGATHVIRSASEGICV